MNPYALSHLADGELMRKVVLDLGHADAHAALVLADLAEIDARKLYLPAGYPDMLAYCVQALHLSEDCACKRIRAARLALQFPVLFPALAERRLHLSAVVLLAPHLTAENVGELIALATGKSSAEIRALLAERFPATERLALVVAAGVTAGSPAPERMESPDGSSALARMDGSSAPERMEAGRSTPVAAGRFAVQFMFSAQANEKLRYAQALLGNAVPPGELAQVFERALDELIVKLERQKFGAGACPRRRSRPSADPRHIPAGVKHEVWKRDGGRCTFVSESGHRCEARAGLEFDHIEPAARGGASTVANLRLRCRGHNQLAAEQAFGAGFMHQKREAARAGAVARDREESARAAAETTRRDREVVESAAHEREAAEAAAAREREAAEEAARNREAAAKAAAEVAARVEAAQRARAAVEELIPYLRQLGFRADQAREVAAQCESIPDAPLEQRLKVALAWYGRWRFRGTVRAAAPN